MSNLQQSYSAAGRLSIASTASRRSSVARQTTTYSKKPEAGEYEVIYSNGAACRKTKDLKSELQTVIPIGSVVTVAEFKGRRCRITAPIPGWISAHTNDNIPIIKKEHEGLLHEGSLSKRGHLNTSWKDRWFILCDDLKVRYYESELNSSMVVNHNKYVCGTIDLLTVHKMEVKVSKNTKASTIPKYTKIIRSDNKDKDKYIIRLISSSRTYILNAKQQSTFETWVHLFNKYIYGGIIYESYGYKLGNSINASFKNRYLVINQYGQIKYYENEKRLQLHGWIDLNTIKSFKRKKLQHNGAATEGLIELNDKNRMWLLCFETNEILMKWCQSLQYLNVPTDEIMDTNDLKEEMKGDHIIKSNLELETELQTLERKAENELQRLERQHENELKILRSQVRELKLKLKKLNRVDQQLKTKKIEFEEERVNSKLLKEKMNKAKDMLRKEKDLTKQLRKHLDELCVRDEAKSNDMEMDGPDAMGDAHATPGFPSLAKKKTVWKRNYLLRKIDKWSNNNIIHWMKNLLGNEYDMSEKDKSGLISAIIDCGCDGKDLIVLESAEDIGYSFDIIENMELCKRIYDDIQKLKLKEKTNLDSLEIEDLNEIRFLVNIYSQGAYITLHEKVTKKTTIQNVKRLYKEQSGVSAGLRDIHFYAKMKSLVKWKTLEQCGIVDDKHLITVKFETDGGGE
eukprot:393412_1